MCKGLERCLAGLVGWMVEDEAGGWAGATPCRVLSLRVMGQHERALSRGDSTFPILRQHMDIGMESLGGSEQ